MKPRKILIFSLVYYPQYVGGAEIAIKEITDRIGKDQTEFHMITLRRSSLEHTEGNVGDIQVHRIGWPFFKGDIVSHHPFVLVVHKILYPILAFLKAMYIHKKYNFSGTWSVMANYSGFAGIFFKIFHPHIPLILSLQEGDSEKHLKYRWAGLIALSWKLTLRKADYILAISNFLLQRGKKIGFTGEGYVIPNGVDITRYSQEMHSEERNNIRHNIGLQPGDVGLITSSRLNTKNAIADVIQALPLLPGNVKFVVCGTGELERDLKSLSNKLNVQDRVFFLGHVPHAQVFSYLKASDIFIRPSLSEGMGNSFIEAMAARIPVIATPVGGIPDFLFDDPADIHAAKRTGYLTQPQSPQDIANTVQRVLQDANKNTVINNAYEMVRETYDWNTIAAKINSNVLEKCNG